MPSPNRLVPSAASARSSVVRFLAPVGSCFLLATGLTAVGWLVASRWPAPGGTVAFFAANFAVLWIAGHPLRKTKTALAELSRSTAALEAIERENATERERSRREFEAIHASLDAFSHSVSHDLRAPLRGILNYTKAVLEDDEKNLSAESKAYLGYSIQAAHRSNELIERFLELARASIKPLDKTQFDLAAMASSAVETLRARDPSRVVAFVGPESAKIYGDRSLLRKVIENLLSNAWKFTSRTADARIEFAVGEDAQGAFYAIRDNGVGFEMAQVDRLFRNFSRLHTNDEFEGTGVGLSIAHRILERHGGWIRAQGEPGEGAEFRFWLPPGTDAPA